MTRDEIRSAIASLAKSQGKYGRLNEKLEYMQFSMPEWYEETMLFLENQHFKDVVDLVMWLENY